MTPTSPLVITVVLTLQLNAVNAAAPHDDLEELDRVQVYGTKLERWELRQAIIEAEDRFYERYNELNTDDDFDVKCRVEARIGTRLTTRMCRPLYQEAAVQENAKQAVEVRQYFQATGQLGTPPVPAEIVIMARRPDFERHMRKVVLESPELGELLHERAIAAEALEAAMRREAEEVGGKRQSREPPEPFSK